MIIKSVAIGPNYRKITMSCRGLKNDVVFPGRCINVDGKILAPTEVRDEEFDAVVPARPNYFDARRVIEHSFPVGPGYSDPDAPEAILVGGGSGMGTLVALLRHRESKSLVTHVRLVGKSLSDESVTEVFPEFNRVKSFSTWDTVQTNRRPEIDELLSGLNSRLPIFFSGPISLFSSLKVSPLKLDLRFNH